MTGLSLSETDTPLKPSRTGRLCLVAAVCALGGALAAWLLSRGEGLPAGVSPDDYSRAERRFEELYGRTADRADVLSVLGELAVADGRLPVAVACFREIPSDHPLYGLGARLQEGQVLARLNRAGEAEPSLRMFLALADAEGTVPAAELVAAYKWLTYLLSVELRFEERKAALAEVHARGLADVNDSKQYYFPHLLIWHSTSGRDPLAQYLRNDPRNPRLRVALARYRTFEGRLDEAQALLDEVRRERPHDLDCAAALLECHFERNDWQKFAEVANTVPDYARGEPWLLTRMRAQRALDERRWEEAVRHFERVLADDPANSWCYTGLARAQGELGQARERDEAQRRSLVLADIRVNLYNVNESDPEASSAIAAACEQIGFDDAGETFRQHAARIARAGGQLQTVRPVAR